jgi:3-methyladenine DNA glycosylase/8-oxoguanine DNA glycosylase
MSSQKSQVVIDGKIELRHSESDHDEDVYGWLTDEDGIGWAFTPKS